MAQRGVELTIFTGNLGAGCQTVGSDYSIMLKENQKQK